MPDDLCIHDLCPDWCSLCKHGLKLNNPGELDYTFGVKSETPCGKCHQQIAIGEKAAKTTRGWTVHRSCISTRSKSA